MEEGGGGGGWWRSLGKTTIVGMEETSPGAGWANDEEAEEPC